MSEEKLMQILAELFDQELTPEDAFAILECEITFEEYYEGE